MAWKYDIKSLGTVTGSHTAATTSINVGTGEGARFANSPRKLVIYEASYYDSPSEAINDSKGEIVIQTAQASDVLTVERGVDGTSALDMTDTNKIWHIANFVDVSMGGEMVNVKTFGAVGDGAEDDTDAVHNAFTHAGAGGTVFFPAGTYDLATWPDAGHDYGARTILGEGTASVIDGPATALFLDVSDELYVHGLSFTGWLKAFEFDPISSQIELVCIEMCTFSGIDRALGWTNPTGGGIVENFTIKACNFNTLTERAIHLYGEWLHMTVEGCRIEDVVDGAIALGREEDADEADWNKTRVAGNAIKGVTTAAGTVHAVAVYGKDAVITENSIEDVSGASTETTGIHCMSQRAVISNNTLLNVDGSAGFRGIGIQVQGNDISAAETSLPDGYNVVVQGNVIDMADKDDSRGIYAANDNVNVSNNVIVGVREIGISTDQTTARTHSHILIQGNLIEFATVGSPGTGIYMAASGDRYHIIGNVINDGVKGVEFFASAGTPTDWVVRGNTINVTTTGIRFNPLVAVTGIACDHNHIAGATTGISFGTTTPDNVQCLWNSFRGVTNEWSLGVTPTNFLRSRPNSGVLELYQQLTIIAGGLAVIAGGVTVTAGLLTLEGTNVVRNGTGVPAGGLGSDGDVFLRSDGGSGTTFYVKESGSWVAK